MKSIEVKTLVVALGMLGLPTLVLADADYAATPDGPGQFTYGNSLGAGSFEDWVSFSVATLSDFIATGSGTSSGSISLSKFDLYDSAKTSLLQSGSITNDGSGKAFLALNSDTGLVGDYYLHLLGTTSGGTYNGNISLSPVPEPESYAMMLAGLGLMGFIARRRAKSS